MKPGFGKITFITFAFGLLTSQAKASFEEDLQIQMFKYATENAPTFYLSSKSVFLTENFLAKVDTYFESGSKGAWSIDPDPVRYQWKLGPEGRNSLWLGREHPLHLIRSVPVEATTALGNVWTQNQLDALNPRVSGWIGMGYVQELHAEWKLLLAYSPIFIPTFGPSLGFTERGELNPSRFARLPPASVNTGGIILPIRYQLRLSQMDELLLQHQAMLAVAHKTESVDFDVYAYTAPKPVPIPITDAVLTPGSGDIVNAEVQVRPQFPREYFGGARVQFKDVKFEPALELTQALNDYTAHFVSITGYFNSLKLNANLVSRTTNRASFGILSHFQKIYEGPTFSDFMAFIRVPVAITQDLEYRTLLQKTLMGNRGSAYWLNELEWAMSKSISILAAVRILTGDDNTYFGDWRNLDSYSAGMRWVW